MIVKNSQPDHQADVRIEVFLDVEGWTHKQPLFDSKWEFNPATGFTDVVQLYAGERCYMVQSVRYTYRGNRVWLRGPWITKSGKPSKNPESLWIALTDVPQELQDAIKNEVDRQMKELHEFTEDYMKKTYNKKVAA